MRVVKRKKNFDKLFYTLIHISFLLSPRIFARYSQRWWWCRKYSFNTLFKDARALGDIKTVQVPLRMPHCIGTLLTHFSFSHIYTQFVRYVWFGWMQCIHMRVSTHTHGCNKFMTRANRVFFNYSRNSYFISYVWEMLWGDGAFLDLLK